MGNVEKGFKINCGEYYIETIFPFFITFYSAYGVVISEVTSLDISSYGINVEESTNNLFDKIGFIWKEYVDVEESVLNLKARILRENVLRYFRKCNGEENRDGE